MNFLSYQSLFFVSITLLIFILSPSQYRTPVLLIASLIFYFYSQIFFILNILIISTIVYSICNYIIFQKNKNIKFIFFLIGIIIIFGNLIYYKTINSINGLIIPLGISYFSFKLASYIIDTYKGNYNKVSFIEFILYAIFFPQIICGPIHRPNDFFVKLKYIQENYKFSENFEIAFRLILSGLFLKLIIGDRLNEFINVVSKADLNYSKEVIFLLTISYTLQMFADFAGYTNIVRGISKLFGIDSPINFNSPFLARNMIDFWRRWHISLSSWINDYLFSFLQIHFRYYGNLGIYFSLTLTMTLIGLWHGFTLNFLIFGLIHSFLLIITIYFQNKKFNYYLINISRKFSYFYIFLGCIFTFLFMSFSLIFFRNNDISSSLKQIQILLGIASPGILTYNDIRNDIIDPVYLCILASYYYGIGMPGFQYFKNKILIKIPNYLQYGGILFAISALSTESSMSFLYGQF